tara:strand:+ start:368 stop:658 length:291 start_codon:yes stop_codon:yes gene_type:complete
MNKPKRRPNSLAEQMKIKRFDPVELKAWNSLFADIKFKNKKVCSKKIFDGECAKDPPPKEKPKKKLDVLKEQRAKPFKKKKVKNPKVFIENNYSKK